MVYRLHAHIVLTPKYRRKVMTDRVNADLRSSFEEVCGRFDVSLDAFETDRDHAHLLVTYPPKVALSRLVMSLKTISSMRVRAHDLAGSDQGTSGGPLLVAVVRRGVMRRNSARRGESLRREPAVAQQKTRMATAVTVSRSLDPFLTEGGCAPTRSKLYSLIVRVIRAGVHLELHGQCGFTRSH